MLRQNFVCRLNIAQQTSDVKQWLHKCKAALINVSGGTTCRVQPLDVSINKPLKNYVRELLDQHLATNLVLYIEGKLTVGGKLTFTKKWVAEAWGPVKKQLNVIINLSQSCGLSNNMELSEDDLVNITVIPASIYMLKVNNKNTRTRYEICSKLTIKTPERHHWRLSVVFIANFEYISHFALVFYC